jgi:fusion and transport protein UGO1
MVAVTSRKRKLNEGSTQPKFKRKFKPQKNYNSDSEDEPVEAQLTKQARSAETVKSILKPSKHEKSILDDSDNEDDNQSSASVSDNDEDDDGAESEITNADTDSEADSDDSLNEDEYDLESATSLSTSSRSIPKRKDPAIFSTSIQAILNSKLSNSKRSDPVLSRSVAAATASSEALDEKLAQKAKKALRDEKRAALDKGRVKDVLADVGTEGGSIIEREKLLRKTAQRGVVRLFNAVRAAQVKAETARKETVNTVIGQRSRKERVDEVSKEGFLEMIRTGGKASV